MKKLFITTTLAVSMLTLLASTSTVQATQAVKTKQPKLLASLPQAYNSPASFTIDAFNNVLFTSPNLHNETFVKQRVISQPATPVIGLINQKNDVETWYTFKQEDMEPTSKTVVPMGLAKGPDGNIYIADMQLWAGGESRIIRVNVKEGKAVSVDVVAKGMSFPNALAWNGNDLYVTDTVLATVKGKSTTSGVYKFNLKQLTANKPVQISAFKNKNEHDKHLFEIFTSNGSLGFGANGLAFDDQGNMYTGLMEDGTVFKTSQDESGNQLKSRLFAKGMIANDGMHWDKRTQSLYITDLFDNAVYSITLDGKLTLLAKNGDTTGANGELDAPGEVIVRGNQAYVNNFDAAFGAPTMVNTKADAPVTISVIDID
ncbi:MAG: hypothetical protein AAGB12_06620 [Pseudomonadota bacterium]